MGRIQHVRNSLNGEVKVLTPTQTYFVDGFHGCKRCFPDKRNISRNCHPDRTVEEVYEATARKTQMLRAAGYTVVGKWECEYKEDKQTDPDLSLSESVRSRTALGA